MMSIAKIRCPGGLANHLVIDMAQSGCGDVEDGIGVRFEGSPPGCDDVAWSKSGCGFVLSWEDFERAYLAVKSARAEGPEKGGST